MKKEPKARVVVVADDDEEGNAPPLSRATTSANATTAPATPPKIAPPPKDRRSPSPRSSQIPDSLRVPRERLDALFGSVGVGGGSLGFGPLAPTRETVSAVAADGRLVALLDDADVMPSVARVAGEPSRFREELALLAKSGKAMKFVELYRRMASIVGKRCEALGGDGGAEGDEAEDEETRQETKGKKKSDVVLDADAAPEAIKGLSLGAEAEKRQREEHRHAGIQVLPRE